MTESMVESRAERQGEKGDRGAGCWQAAVVVSELSIR
jgi:hypothetical protein